jgi:hypothetical protein
MLLAAFLHRLDELSMATNHSPSAIEIDRHTREIEKQFYIALIVNKM